MNFQDALQTCFRKWLTIEGRASRSEYWWFQLFYIILAAAMTIVSNHSGILALVFLLVYLYLFVVQFTVSVRRLHDTNRTGWWLLIGFIPLIGALILLYFFILPSDESANQYGSL